MGQKVYLQEANLDCSYLAPAHLVPIESLHLYDKHLQ